MRKIVGADVGRRRQVNSRRCSCRRACSAAQRSAAQRSAAQRLYTYTFLRSPAIPPHFSSAAYALCAPHLNRA
jgi:hypothetical protein